MLVLSRKPGETIVIDGRIRLTVVDMKHGQVRLSFEAPPDVQIDREELAIRKQAGKAGEPDENN